MVDEHEPPSLLELEARLDALRGDVYLKIPAASAVKIGGERAYKLHRRGVAVEMPTRRTTVYELELEEYEEPVAQLSMLLSSGGYVRAVAEALGGHCVSLRRTSVGPFDVADADPERIIDPADALARSREGRAQARRTRCGASGARARDLDGVHLGHRRVIETLRDSGPEPTVLTFDPHPRTALGNRVELLMPLERRLELLGELGVAEALVVEFTLEVARLDPREFADQFLRADRRRDRRRGRGLSVRSQAGGRSRLPRQPRVRHAARTARRGRLRDPDPRARGGR